MSAEIIRLGDHRKISPGPEPLCAACRKDGDAFICLGHANPICKSPMREESPNPMSLLFGGLEFYGICQIAILFGGIAALRIIHERLYGW